MRPTQSQSQSQSQCSDLHGKRDQNGMCPSPLKLNKESHMILKKSSSSSSSSPPSSSSHHQHHHRHPVIIYTHSPKIIHTSPKDFMALVQKLTGLSQSNNNNKGSSNNIEDYHNHHHHHQGTSIDHQNPNALSDDEGNKNLKNIDDNESSSVITSDENCSGGGGGTGGVNIGEGQVNSSFVPAPPIFEPPTNPYLPNNFPIFNPNSADFLCTNPTFYNYTTDSLFFPPKMRGSISSSSPPDHQQHHHHHPHQGMNDFHEF